MKFKDLNGKIHKKNLTPYKRSQGQTSKSKGQSKLGEILSEIWPNIPIYEEVPCAGTKLFLDFLVESLRIAFEFDGKQHSEFNNFFYKNRYEFNRAKERDVIKQEWCEINSITLIRIKEEDLDIEKIKEMINEGND